MNINQFNLLTDDEKKLFHALKNLRGGGMWGHSIRTWVNVVNGDEEVWSEAINNQVNHGSAECFRHLIASLQSQAHDNPSLMLRILGSETYQLVMLLEALPA